MSMVWLTQPMWGPPSFLGSPWGPPPFALSVQGGVWPYLVLFLAVVAGGAGVPMIGTAALSATAALASQHLLSIDVVLAVACVAAVIGGVVGYGVGRRWGVSLMERPGRHEQERRKALAKGHELYERWGWLACFVIPAYVAGTASMVFLVFFIFNSIAAVSYQFATGLSAYGVGRVATGHADAKSVVALAVGLALIALVVWLLIRRHRRSRADDLMDRVPAGPTVGL
jgi:membrane-associated protein